MEENPKSLITRSRLAKTSPRDIPGDIIINILSRLPVKSLMRFRCVCKSLNALVSDPNFIDMHLSESCANNNGCVLIRLGSVNTDVYDVSLCCYETFVEHTRLKIPFEKSFKLFTVNGFCNGLLCLTFFPMRNTCLWNPSTRKFKALPNSPLFCDEFPCTIVSFSFVPLINDYKVLRLFYHRYISLPLVFEIYSLSTNYWKRVQNVVPCYVNYDTMNAIVNGGAHWVAQMVTEGDDDYEFILSFDMANEVFGEIKLPEFGGRDDTKKSLWVLMDSLSLFVDCTDERTEVWVMKEYGVIGSWTKQFTFDKWVCPFGFMKNGEIILGFIKNGEALFDTDEGLVSYDPRIQQVKCLPIHLPIHRIAWTSDVVTYYKESLVLI